ncbi:hypothetical protein HC766_02000 [Candidatus Gracilibacteria bacterium]|nr:hypothetical protein [Candidatus Gracilibacteria bacterium]
MNWQKPDKEVLKWHKSELGQSLENLNQIKELIQEKFLDIKSNEIDLVEAFLSKSKQWEDLIKKWLEKNSYDTGAYLWPLRVALSGQAKSPSPFEILSVLDKDEILNRINSVTK